MYFECAVKRLEIKTEREKVGKPMWRKNNFKKKLFENSVSNIKIMLYALFNRKQKLAQPNHGQIFNFSRVRNLGVHVDKLTVSIYSFTESDDDPCS